MNNNQVETDSLNHAAVALQMYINDVEADLHKLQTAANDCYDNMGQDQISLKATQRLQHCVTSMKKTLEYAAEIRQRILKLVAQIEKVPERV